MGKEQHPLSNGNKRLNDKISFPIWPKTRHYLARDQITKHTGDGVIRIHKGFSMADRLFSLLFYITKWIEGKKT